MKKIAVLLALLALAAWTPRDRVLNKQKAEPVPYIWYGLDDNSDSTVVSSAGTLTTAGTSARNTSVITSSTAKIATAFDLYTGATDDSIDVGIACTGLTGTNPSTYCTWLQRDSLGESNGGKFMACGAGAVGTVYWGGDGTSLCMYSGSELCTGNGTMPASGTTWYHVCFTRTAAGAGAIYVNGAQLAAGATGTSNNTGNLRFGNSAADDRAFDGRLDEIKVFQKALSSAEVKSVYRSSKRSPVATTPTPTPTPAAFDAADYGTVLVWYDMTDNATLLDAGDAPAADAEAIKTITDKGTLGINLVEATYQPVLDADGFNASYPAVVFGGNDGFLLSGANGGTISKNRAGLTVVLMAKTATFAAAQRIIFLSDNTTNNRVALSMLAGGLDKLFAELKPQDAGTPAELYQGSSLPSVDTWYIWTFTLNFSGNAATIHQDSTQVATSSDIGSTGNTSNTASSSSDSNGLFHNGYGSVGWNGTVAQLIVYDGVMDATNRGNLVTALQAYQSGS